MISFEDRMALVRAGYTASQIEQFDDPPEQKTPISNPEPDTEPHPEPNPEPNPNTGDFTSMMQSINNYMAAIVAAMQAQNIKSADMGEPVKETPGDILAKLLNP